MSRIEELFKRKNKNILNIYFTAGFPQLNSTVEILKGLEENGADIIELGIPYSDPLADGPLIQASNMQALNNGMSVSFLLEQLKDIRQAVNIPIILMGYLNPILQYGFEKFCTEAADVGIDGLIIPDIPMYEYENYYKNIIEKNNLNFIFLITPETSELRIRKLDELSSGFIYAVSSSSITGTDKNFDSLEAYLSKLKYINLKNPILVGFGVKDKQSFSAVCKHANGAIIGSAFIKVLSSSKNMKESIKEFMKVLN